MSNARKEFDKSFKRGSWVAGIVLFLVALPFLWGTAYMTYRSLWFQYGAARAEGTVVEISEGTPSLTLEYRTQGGDVRKIESGGSDYYRNYQRGDKLTVFYDPQDPADARIDLWLEHWILPILVLVPGAGILLAMFLITSHMRKDPFAKPQLETGGVLVPAEFLRVRLGVDMDLDRERAAGDFTLKEEDGRYELTHNGEKRDPYDPKVQRDLGLCYIVEARGKDPRTGVERIYESDPLDSNPERLIQGRTINVYVDPRRHDVYRMELPGQAKKSSQPASSKTSPITKL